MFHAPSPLPASVLTIPFRQSYFKDIITLKMCIRDRFYDVREDRDHEVVVFLLLVKLFGDDIFKVALPGIQKHRVRDAAAHDRRVKRAADIVKRAQVVSALYVGGGVVGRDHDDGEMCIRDR